MQGQLVVLVAVLSTLACLNGAQAGFGFGPCPSSREPMPDFQITRYAGHWFELASFGNFFEKYGKCNQANYTLNQEGGFNVRNVMIDENTNQIKSIEGWATPEDNSGRASLRVTIPLGFYNRTATLWILGTDYDTYSVAYSCVNFSVFHYDFSWILLRRPNLQNQEEISEIMYVLGANQLRDNQYTFRTQDCGVLE